MSEGQNKSILFVSDDWGRMRSGIASVNYSLATSLAKFQSISVYSTVLFPVEVLPEAFLDDAQRQNVTLIGPNTEFVDSEPSLAWLHAMPETYYSEISTKVQNVTHIIGHSAITAKTALLFRDLYYPNAKVILFYHVLPSDIEWLTEDILSPIPTEANLIDWAEQADVVYSVTDRIYSFFSTRFLNRSREKIDHRLYLPQCPEQLFQIPRNVCNGTDRTILALGSTKPWIGTDIGVCTLGKAHTAVVGTEAGKLFPNMSLTLGGVPNDETDVIKQAIDEYLDSKSIPVPVKFNEYADPMALVKDLSESAVCLVPSKAEPFGSVGLEPVCAGVPTLIYEDSSVASLIRYLSPDPELFLVPVTADCTAVRQDSSVWKDRLISMLKSPEKSQEKASQLREALRKDERIKDTLDNFVAYVVGGISVKFDVTKVEFLRTRDEDAKEIPTLIALNKFTTQTLKQCWRLKHDPLTAIEDLDPVVPGVELQLNSVVNDVIDFLEEYDRRIVGVSTDSGAFIVYCPNETSLGNLWAMCDRINRAWYKNIVSEDNRQVLERFKLDRIYTRTTISGPQFLKYTRELSNY